MFIFTFISIFIFRISKFIHKNFEKLIKIHCFFLFCILGASESGKVKLKELFLLLEESWLCAATQGGEGVKLNQFFSQARFGLLQQVRN